MMDEPRLPTWEAAVQDWLRDFRFFVSDCAQQLDNYKNTLGQRLRPIEEITAPQVPGWQAQHELLRESGDSLTRSLDELLDTHSFETVRSRWVATTSWGEHTDAVVPESIKGVLVEARVALKSLSAHESRLLKVASSHKAREEERNTRRRAFGSFAPPQKEQRGLTKGYLNELGAVSAMETAGSDCVRIIESLSAELGSTGTGRARSTESAPDPALKRVGRREHPWKREILAKYQRRVSDGITKPMQALEAEHLLAWAESGSIGELQLGQSKPKLGTIENWIRELKKSL